MSRVAEFYGLDIAFAVFIVLFVLSRVISRSAMKLLDDESKVKLVDASARANWWYLPLLPIIFLFYWRFVIGAVALIAYVLIGMAYNIQWHYRNQMPKPFRSRVLMANGIIILGFLLLVLGYVAEARDASLDG